MKNIQQQLAALDAQQMRRFLREIESASGPRVQFGGRDYLLLCSNNYLGLADHPQLIEASCRATRDFGTGSGASRLVCGSLSLHDRLEEALAHFKGSESALLFNSGYAANTGILQALYGPDDLIFSDVLNHASIIDGCRLSGARVLVYAHNNLAALEELLEQEKPRRRGRWLIVSDGVFSMDGDLAPLPGLVALKERYDAWLMIDDAHGGGVLGAGGRGTAEHFGCLDKIDLHMGTFGKALGSYGAYLAASRAVTDLLINRARSFIYSTSLPPGVAAANLAALKLVDSPTGAHLRAQLESHRRLFAGRLSAAGLNLCGSQTQIVPILTVNPEPTMQAAAALLDHGIFISGIRPPTVPSGTCRLRATLMASHDPQDILAAADTIIALLASGGAR